MLLHGRSTDGRFIQRPFGPIRAHMGPYGPIWGPYGAHMGPYGPIWAYMGPYGPIWARMGPARAHAPHETISEINPFFEKKAPVRTNHVSTDHLSAPDVRSQRERVQPCLSNGQIARPTNCKVISASETWPLPPSRSIVYLLVGPGLFRLHAFQPW